MAVFAFGVAALCALVDWYAVAWRERRLEYICKPATLCALIGAAWLLTQGAHDSWAAGFFLLALIVSLGGDVFLMIPGERFFMLGLVSFLLAHLAYIAGLNPSPPPLLSLVWLLPIIVVGAALFRGIADGLGRRGQASLLIPVAMYSVVISLMLFSAWATLFRAGWTTTRQVLVVAGATLFFGSDALLAWDRFVTALPMARIGVIVTYHLAQFALAASIAL